MDANMEIVYERACGIDVHKREIVVCLITGQRKAVTKKYGTLTRDLPDWTILVHTCLYGFLYFQF